MYYMYDMSAQYMGANYSVYTCIYVLPVHTCTSMECVAQRQTSMLVAALDTTLMWVVSEQPLRKYMQVSQGSLRVRMLQSLIGSASSSSSLSTPSLMDALGTRPGHVNCPIRAPFLCMYLG